MARAVACGSRQKSKTLSCCTPPPARAWDISGPCACGMAALCFVAKPANSMGPASFSFSSNSAPPAAGLGDGWSSSPTMPLITLPPAPTVAGRTRPRFALDSLPPYSPELNPIERAWKLTRHRCLHNRYFDKLEDVISAAEAEFANWTTRNDAMRTYLRRYVLVRQLLSSCATDA